MESSLLLPGDSPDLLRRLTEFDGMYASIQTSFGCTFFEAPESPLHDPGEWLAHLRTSGRLRSLPFDGRGFNLDLAGSHDGTGSGQMMVVKSNDCAPDDHQYWSLAVRLYPTAGQDTHWDPEATDLRKREAAACWLSLRVPPGSLFVRILNV